MSLAQSLDHLHRHLTRLWADAPARPDALTYSEREYLRAIERLDGDKVAKADAPGGGEDHGQQGHHLQDLVDILGVHKASASAAIAKLEKRGLVARFPCRYDARAQHIVLTERAKALLRDDTIYAATAARIEQILTPEEFQSLTAALAKVRDHL